MSAHSQENGSEQPQSTPDASTPSSVGGEAGPSAANERTSSEASHHTGGSRPVPPTLPEEDDIESEDDLDEHLEPPAWDGIRRRKRVPGDTRIRPAYYYPTDGNTSSRSKARGVPVFEPTWDEFKDFYQYVQKIDKYGMQSGVVKVVPPKEWTDALPEVKARLKHTRIRSPIAELIHGSTGLFRQTNITRSKHWNAQQWKEMSEQPKYAMPDFFGTGDPVALAEQRRNGRRDQSRAAKEAAAKAKAVDQHQEQEEAVKEEAVEDTEMQEDSISQTSQASPPASAKLAPGQPGKTDVTSSSPAVSQTQKKSSGSKRNQLTTTAKADIDHAAWEDFDYKSMMHGLKVEHFTVENCADVEKRYWRTLTFGEPPMYGADLEGSLFTEKTKSWNVANLQDLLKRMCPNSSIPGVTQPYLYFGTWRATFSWHVEDADLYSINYVHFGAPKFWYSVPQAQAERFERVMANWFPTDRQKCSQFLRHKSFLASPRKLADQGISLNKCVQHAGEFMITYPRGYHSGFNVGFNCAESINFATPRWIEYGRSTKACMCVSDSVRLNADVLLADARRDALLNPEIEAAIPPEYRDGPIADVPMFPLNTKRNKMDPYSEEAIAIVEAKRAEREANRAAREATLEAKQAKQARREEKAAAAQSLQEELKERKKSYVCCLCPDTSRTSLVKLGKPTAKKSNSTMRKPAAAHKLCVMFMPGAYLGEDPSTGEERAYGVENVEKARWQLKCQACPDTHGAKIQCTKTAKCARAYHVTCAVSETSGAFLDAIVGEGPKAMSLIQSARVPGSSVLDIFGDAAASTGSTAPPSPQQKTLASQIQSSEVPAPAERENDALSDATADAALAGDPTDSIKLEMWCRQHNPEFVKMQAQQKAQAAWDRAQALPVGSWIRIKTSSGIFQVQLVSHVEDTSSILVAFEDGRQMSYKATAILWPEPSAPAPTKRSWDGQSRAAPSLSKSRSGAPMPQLVSVPGPDGTLQYFYAVPLPPRQPHQHHNHTEMQPPSHMFPPSALPHGPPVGYWHPRHPQDFQHPQVTWAQPQVAGQHPQALPTSGLAPPSHTQGQSIGGPTHSMPLLPPQSATLPPSFSAPSSSSATQFGWPGSATLPHSPFMPPPQMPPPQPCHTPVEAATG